MIITAKKLIALLLIFIALTNMILFALGKVSTLWFWGVIIIVAMLTWWQFPKKSQKKIKDER
ncbi:hypothetical protein GF351_01490 [Candidatus Woesearchaeota archaeon]|nr:hypothetical protein [Candidatus Woesearchaeota archaeon]